MKIFVHMRTATGRDSYGVQPSDVFWEALTEDGIVLAHGVSSNRDWALLDSGLDPQPPRAAPLAYALHSPNGYELIEAPGPDEQAWLAVQAAVALRTERAA